MQRTDIRKSSDATTDSILFEGANLSQMAVLFKCDERTLKQKMHGIMPVGKRYNAAIYDVSQVAARMGKLSEEQIDAAMRRMNHADLPKMLTKEYWNGLKAKQDYQQREGDLWPTDKVISEVGEMVKILNMELDLLTDGIERNNEMTERQRTVATQLVRGAKTNMLKRLRERFDPDHVITPEVKKPVVVEEDDDEL